LPTLFAARLSSFDLRHAAKVLFGCTRSGSEPGQPIRPLATTQGICTEMFSSSPGVVFSGEVHDSIFINPQAEHVHHLCSIHEPQLPQFHPKRSGCAAAGLGTAHRGVLVAAATVFGSPAALDLPVPDDAAAKAPWGRSVAQASQARYCIGLM